MNEYPIPFNSEMVRAILDGRKTQTRRVIKPQPDKILQGDWSELCKYKVGDLLWVREGYQLNEYSFRRNCAGGKYLADNKEFWTEVYQREYELINNRKKPYAKTSGRFMYKSIARIWLEITGIRVERVQDITPEDIVAEGIEHCTDLGKMESDNFRFIVLWDSINANRGFSWVSNPWVWVMEFVRHDGITV